MKYDSNSEEADPFFSNFCPQTYFHHLCISAQTIWPHIDIEKQREQISIAKIQIDHRLFGMVLILSSQDEEKTSAMVFLRKVGKFL